MTERKKMLAKAVAFPFALIVGGCQSVHSPSAAGCDGAMWTEALLFFGRDIPDGDEVTEAMWQEFVDQQVAPRFSGGFTVFDGTGFWLDPVRLETIKEDNKVLMVLYPPGGNAGNALSEIAGAYKRQFRQQAVMRTEQPVCVKFHSDSAEPKRR